MNSRSAQTVDRVESPTPSPWPLARNMKDLVELPELHDSLRVLMAAGGTGGHIFPALAVAEELRARALEREMDNSSFAIRFVGTGRGLESRLIPDAGFPLDTVAAAGLKGMGGWKKVRNLLVLPQSAVDTARILREFKPNVVMGIGGYLAGPVMLEAALQGIPTLLFEPNVVPGFTNRVLGPVVNLAAVGFEETAHFYGEKARLTGHPVRRDFFQIEPKKHVPPFTVLIVGGSQGSKAINECVVKSLPLLEAEGWRVIHQTGERDYNGVEEAYRRSKVLAEICAFIENMPEAFARADLVVSRAGAMTVAELAAAGKAAVLIPFPAAADRHQLQNALAMERVGAARVIEQCQLSPERLVDRLREIISQPGKLEKMELRARTFARPEAAKQIADLIEDLAVHER